MSAKGKVVKTSVVSGGNKTPTEKMAAYLDRYIANGGDHKEAWVWAGYSEARVSQAKAALREHWQYIESALETHIGSQVPFALDGVIALAKNASGEAVRLKACQDLLSRAGYDGVKKIETTMRTEDMSDEDLDKELHQMLTDAGLANDGEAEALH